MNPLCFKEHGDGLKATQKMIYIIFFMRSGDTTSGIKIKTMKSMITFLI